MVIKRIKERHLVVMFVVILAGALSFFLQAAPKNDEKAENGELEAIELFLTSRGSPLRGYGRVFLDAAKENGLDWMILPAICWKASWCGRDAAAMALKNPFALRLKKKGLIRFSSVTASIFAAAKVVKKKYKGLPPKQILLLYDGRF